MNINNKIKTQFKLQNILFYVLLLVAVALVSQLVIKSNLSADWTENSRHTLSDTTTGFLQQLDKDITIQVFISPNDEYKTVLDSLLLRYQKWSNKLTITLIDPDFSPDLVRELKIQKRGEMVISSGELQTHVFDFSEQSLTNALIEVSHTQEQWLVFIEGHGERTPLKSQNFNLSSWGQQLKQKGFKLQGLNLINHSQIPENTAALVIASPKNKWLEGEINIIKYYIEQGGNVLLLVDPDTHKHSETLAEIVNTEFIPDIVIDPNTASLGIEDPSFILINDYANHPIGQATTSVTLFPKSVALSSINHDEQWTRTSLLNTAENAWAMNNHTASNRKPEFDINHDTMGPLSIGQLLTRELDDDTQQRIVILGDSDFLSNIYLGNAGNLELGMAIVNWLAGEDSLINIPTKTTRDQRIELSKMQSVIISLGFLIFLPLVLFLTGFIIWRIRQRR